VAAVLFSLFALVVPGPAAPGQWHQIGAAAASHPGKQVHLFRSADYPARLGLVATSSSKQLIHVSWWSYCEFESDDGNTEEHQQTITGKHRVVAYPPVFDGATRCYVEVNAHAGPRAAVAAAVFSG
jgi:hypothetical protein